MDDQSRVDSPTDIKEEGRRSPWKRRAIRWYCEQVPVTDLEIDRKVADILQELTLKEKCRLLSSQGWRRFYSATDIKRLGIPALKVTDGPLGVAYHSSRKKATRFPATIALAATWDRQLARDVGVVLGEEVRRAGRHVLLAPGINIMRTPLCGRTFEYFSEDPLLTRELATQLVRGIQSQGVGACVKHFAANNQETDRKHVSSEIDERTLHEIYLRAFEGVVRNAGPWAIMAAYNRLNGVYCSENSFLLRDVLMNKWGFDGLVMTDWFAAYDSKTPATSMVAGLSLEMPRPSRYKVSKLMRSLKAGEFNEEALDDHVGRFLRVLFRTHAFETREWRTKNISSEKSQLLARRIAQESMVLLKNEHDALPLDKTESVCVQGPNLKKKFGRFLYGGSSAVVPPFEVTPLEGMRHKNKRTVSDGRFACVVGSEALVLFMGLDHGRGNDSEFNDRRSISLPEKQIQLIRDAACESERTVVVLIAGSPLSMTGWIDDVDAVVMAWYPGMIGGHAIADVLYGDVNPSGRLPVTFPKRLEDSAAHSTGLRRNFPGDEEKRVFYEEGLFVGYRWFDERGIEPLFPFGFGMSYTRFSLDNPTLLSSSPLILQVDVTNTGEVSGSNVVQVYAHDIESSVKRPPKELVGFSKIHLDPGETRTIQIDIDTSDLAFYDVEKHDWVIEPGDFVLRIGHSSRNLPLSVTFNYE
ncbi:MAG: glycosyl hydrolase [Candidatus Thorarchaeota archaeon]|nr:MAG: glycosyl hydrolase [Candidatus Thorarchaeota archaeon]